MEVLLNSAGNWKECQEDELLQEFGRALRMARTQESLASVPGRRLLSSRELTPPTLPRPPPITPPYPAAATSSVSTPALLFFKALIRRNLAVAIEIAGGPQRLRPHVKTHKTREIVYLELQAGVTKHKCATLAEAEMLASCGAPDVFLAYNLVGPNCDRMARLVRTYPQTRFAVQTDYPDAARALSEAMNQAGQTVDVLLDLDVGQHRTGIEPGDEALALYELIGSLPGLRPGGLHVYDGHNHQESFDERQAAVGRLLEPVLVLRAALEKKGLPVPRLVCGGTPTFPVFARLDLPGLECAPGTCFLHDHGYGSKFTDMSGFTPAALLLTRVISRPTDTRITFDLGYKAAASDPPAGNRPGPPPGPRHQRGPQNR